MEPVKGSMTIQPGRCPRRRLGCSEWSPSTHLPFRREEQGSPGNSHEERAGGEEKGEWVGCGLSRDLKEQPGSLDWSLQASGAGGTLQQRPHGLGDFLARCPWREKPRPEVHVSRANNTKALSAVVWLCLPTSPTASLVISGVPLPSGRTVGLASPQVSSSQSTGLLVCSSAHLRSCPTKCLPGFKCHLL